MSMYSDYVLEREGYFCFETECSFVTFKKIGNVVYLRDMYVDKENRLNGKGRELISHVLNYAKNNNCNKIITTVDRKTNNAEVNEVNILKEGFSRLNQEGNVVYFVKEI